MLIILFFPVYYRVCACHVAAVEHDGPVSYYAPFLEAPPLVNETVVFHARARVQLVKLALRQAAVNKGVIFRLDYRGKAPKKA
jgi:hypothetical protein